MAQQYDLAPSVDDGEIDLGRYAAALGRRWRLVAVVTALAVVAAFAVSLLLRAAVPKYQAQATVLLMGAKYQLQLDPKFTTVNTLNSASATRAEEFQALAAAPEVQQAAVAQLGPAGGASDLPPVDVKARGNVLTVTATAPDPARAAAWANAYATAAASRLDAVYGVADADRSALEKQLADAVTNQDTAVAKLAQFTRDDRTDALNREIAQKELAVQTLTSQQDGLLRARLAAFYQASADLEQIRRDAESLRNQIQNAAQAPASTAAQALALMNLQTRLTEAGHTRLNENNPPPRPQSPNQPQPQPVESAPRTSAPSGPQLQVGLDSLIGRSASQQDMLGDVDAVIAQTQQRQAAMQAEFDKTMAVVQQRVGTPGANLATGPDDQTRGVVDKLTADIQALRAQVQELQQRRDVLTQDVELAKTARTTLETKLRESSISAATSGGKAVVAASAVPPTAPSFPPPLSRTLPLAAFVGLLLGGFAAVVADARRARPLDRAPVPEPVWQDETPAAAGSLGE
jgi:capsular polysaccharide biosynthesis protein